MAIKKTIIDERFGSEFAGAYIKLAYLRWSDVDNKTIGNFSVWSTPTAEAEGKECIEIIEVDLTHLYPKIQEDAYKEIKKLPKYVDAEDV